MSLSHTGLDNTGIQIPQTPRKAGKRLRKEPQDMAVMPSVSERAQQATENVITTIESGLFDDHLKEIARALFRRRDIIAGTSSFIDRIDKAEGVIVDEAPPMPDILGPYSVLPTTYYAARGSTFRYKDFIYQKGHVEGRRVTVPDHFEIPELVGKAVTIHSIARTRVEVSLEPGTYLVTKRYSLRRAAYSGQRMTVPISVLSGVLSA